MRILGLAKYRGEPSLLMLPLKSLDGLTCGSVVELTQHPEQYDLFVSFNKADREFVDRLVQRVESEQYLGRYLKCFYSEWDIQPGEDILLRIEEELPKSRLVAFVMSPDWLTSNWTTLERVIPVYDDPAGLKGRIIPLLRRDCEVPPSIRILKRIDFRSESIFEKSAKLLVSRLKGEPLRPPRVPQAASAQTLGSPRDAVAPSTQQETLASNLFPVLELPENVYTATTKATNRDEVWSILGEGTEYPQFSFSETERRIYTFAKVNEDGEPFPNLLIPKTVRRLKVEDFLSEERSRPIIEILNRAMTAHMRALGMTYDWRVAKKTYFPMTSLGDDIRRASWGVGSRKSQRIVAIRSKDGSYFAHRYCKATFLYLEGAIYLRIVPGWHFTTDGMEASVSRDSMTSLSARWMNMERNHAVLDDVRFWVNTLASGSNKVELDVEGDTGVLISTVPVFGGIEAGIEGDYRERLWYEEEPESDEAEVKEVAQTGSAEEEDTSD